MKQSKELSGNASDQIPRQEEALKSLLPGPSSHRAKSRKYAKNVAREAKSGKMSSYHVYVVLFIINYMEFYFLTYIYFLSDPVDNNNLTGCCRYDSSLGEPCLKIYCFKPCYFWNEVNNLSFPSSFWQVCWQRNLSSCSRGLRMGVLILTERRIFWRYWLVRVFLILVHKIIAHWFWSWYRSKRGEFMILLMFLKGLVW